MCVLDVCLFDLPRILHLFAVNLADFLKEI